MTKGKVALPLGVMAATTTSQTLFIPDETCCRQVTLLLTLLLMTRAEGWVRNNPTQAKEEKKA
jgi:hypothetical protein